MSAIEKTTEIDKAYVEKQAKDLKKRVEQLYKEISQWLADSNYSLKISPVIKFELFEEPMYRFNVSPIKIEIAAIYKGDKFIGKIAPFGLWVIGSNGALEINTQLRNYKIVDVAEVFSKPAWKIVQRKGFQEQLKPFDKKALLSILDTNHLKIK